MTVLEKAERLMQAYRDGKFGGERLPEDANPGLPADAREHYLYLTLPMALNYQRSAYALWESALATYLDPLTSFVFDPKECVSQPFEAIQQALVKHRLALQKVKQTEIWIALCQTFLERFDGDVRRLFSQNEYSVKKIRIYMQKEHKKEFPYLSGNKIFNYWLNVLHQYTDLQTVDPNEITVAPDTHVCKASLQLGLIDQKEYLSSNVQTVVAERWREVFEGTNHRCIDIHTPLWLWSRAGFPDIFKNPPA